MITQSPYTFPPTVMRAYGSYLNHVLGCPRCSRGGACRKGLRKRHIWRAVARSAPGGASPDITEDSRRVNGGL